MATTDFPIASSNAYPGGDWVQVSVASHNARRHVGLNGEWTVSFTGTKLEIVCFLGSTTPFDVTIDGVTQVPTASGTGSFITFDVTSAHSLSEGTHLCLIKMKSSSGTTYIDSDVGWRVTGASPANPTTANRGTYFLWDSATANSNLRFNPGWAAASTGSYNSVNKGIWTGTAFRVTGNFERLKLFLFCASDEYSLYVDGALTASTTVTAGSGSIYGFIDFTGLDTGASHTYEITCTKAASSFAFFLVGMEYYGGSLSGSQPAQRPTVAFYGHSIVNSFLNIDARNGYPFKVAKALGFEQMVRGTNGAKTSTDGRDNTARVTAFTPDPDVIVVQYGRNDIDVTAIATYKADAKTMFQNIRTGAPSAKIIALYETEKTSSDTNRATYNANLAAGLSEIADANTFVFDTTGILNSGTDYVDSIHWNDAGHTKIKNRVIPRAAAAAFTTSGTSGTVTITLAGGATFSGTDTVTIATSAGTLDGTSAGGTVSPDNASSITVTPPSNATAFTVVGTATGTWTFTNGQSQSGWTNPAASAYTAVSPGGVAGRGRRNSTIARM